MLVGSSIRGNAAAAKSRYLSQVEKRYVTSARGLGEYLVGARTCEHNFMQPVFMSWQPF
jgi:hypothetical protein